MTIVADHMTSEQTTEHEELTLTMPGRKGRTRKSTILAQTNSAMVEIPNITFTTRAYTIDYIMNMIEEGKIDFPEFQRRYIYKSAEEKFLWQSALLHIPMTPAWAYHDETEDVLYIMDGQQRLKGLCKFPNSTGRAVGRLFTEAGRKFHMPNSRLPLIEPGKPFKGMTPFWQKRYLNYEVGITVITGLPEEWMAEVYDIINIHRELSLGEQLWAKNSKAVQVARSLYEHPFWKEVYGDIDLRMDRMSEALTTIAFELCPPQCQVRKGELLNLASGTQDEKITQALTDRISSRLSGLMQPFKGCGANARVDIIPIYQAGLYLEEAGYDLDASEEGCLAAWFKRGKYGMWKNDEVSTKEGIGQLIDHNVYGVMPQLRKQGLFWDEQLPVLLCQEGLVKKDATRAGKPWFDGRVWTTI